MFLKSAFCYRIVIGNDQCFIHVEHYSAQLYMASSLIMRTAKPKPFSILMTSLPDKVLSFAPIEICREFET